MKFSNVSDIAFINNKTLNRSNNYEYINYLDTSNITNGKIDTIQKMNIKDAPSRAKRIIEKDDIVYSTVRPNLCHFGIIRKPVENMIASTGFAVISSKKDMVLPEYLYAFLSLSENIAKLHAIAETSTSTYPSIKPSVIGELVIPLPDIEKQEKISFLLSNIDNKIELNNQLNDNLIAA